ncbi:nicotinamide-nucleotide amidase [Pedobacter sp. UYEF25]
MLAEIITIGDEILIGQIVDTNSAWMAKQLNLIGMSVKQITSVSDDEGHIIEALQNAEKRVDVILITGGLGPTKDDITKFTLAKYFNMGFRRDEPTLEIVKQLFEKLNRPMIELNAKQADVPSGCEVVLNKRGTAPCMWFNEHGKIFVSMPGVPFEMMYLMEEEILPRLKSRFKLPHIIHHTILTAGIGESFLAVQIEDIEASLPPSIKLAYLPKLGQVRLRLSASGYDEAKVRGDVQVFIDKIVHRIKKYVVAEEDIPLEKAIVQLMDTKGFTLSTAESCTGGYIAHLITQIPGCSSVYYGGAVAYSYSLKESVLGVKESTLTDYGAVSEETVKEMAEGALKHFKTDYAVAVSGIAGPGGGLENKPVGTVWISVCNKQQTICKLFHFSNERTQNIERSAAAALTLLLNMLRED